MQETWSLIKKWLRNYHCRIHMINAVY